MIVKVYTDGTFNTSNNCYGSAGRLYIDNYPIPLEFKIKGQDTYKIKSRQTAGELLAVMHAIDYAILLKAERVEIYYDYEAIEKLTLTKEEGGITPRKRLTKNYKTFIDENKNKIIIKFIKVKAHKNKNNIKVDRLAREVTTVE